MLEEIRIAGLGVIEDASLEPASGLTVVTGETGAGKTMVVTALGLLFGGRADVGQIRPGSSAAVVEGRVRLASESPALGRAFDAGGDLDDGALLLSRSIAETRSRSHVGGRAVPVAVLAELAEDILAVHGQSEQLRLLRPERQRAALDRFAGPRVLEPAERYSQTYARLRATEAALEDITAHARERAREADLLRFGLAEIEAVQPRAGEFEGLQAEESRLAHAEDLRSAAENAHAAVLGGPEDGGYEGAPADAVSAVAAARRALEPVREHDPALAQLADRVAELGYLLTDVGGDLGSYSSGIATDPERLTAVQERLRLLAGLLRKYGHDVKSVLAWSQQAANRLASLDDDDSRLDTLRAERARLATELAELAGTLSAGRIDAARRFSRAVQAELAALAMPQARLEVAVTQTTDPKGLVVGDRRLAFGPHGVDSVELLLAAHAGARLRPLHRSASGGELSRVMLAIEVVFAGADPVPTYVFDEVDAGVGGKAAVEVGRRLARLSRTAQVIVVTHLPQVAAFADLHLAVVKSDDGSVTRSGVLRLDGEARVRELARMLAGFEDSATAMAHAAELLAAAARPAAPSVKSSARAGNSGRRTG